MSGALLIQLEDISCFLDITPDFLVQTAFVKLFIECVGGHPPLILFGSTANSDL